MKWLTGIVVASAFTVGISLPALSNPTTTNAIPAQEVRGQVESVDGSVVRLKTSAGDTQSYQVDPTVISALSLKTGSDIVIDGSRLQSGVLTYLTPNNASVALDGNGGEKDYVLTQVSRRYLSIGDRVVITPDLRLIRSDLYKLSSSDLRVQSAMVASSASSSSSYSSASSRTIVRQPANTGGGQMVAPVTAPVETPVRGLW
jgi:hypothetical protein